MKILIPNSRRYNPERGSFSNNGSEWLDNEIPLRRIIKKNIRSHSHHASAYYENKFSGKYLLHFDSDFKRSVADNSTSTMYPRNTADNVNSTDRRESTFGAAKLYLKFPFKQGEFTIGTQDSYTRTTLDYRMLNPLTETYIPSSQTDARQSVAALFASWSRTCGKFNLSAGARYEYVDYDFRVNGVRDERISRRDHLLTPDISLGYSFGNNAQMSLSYKMATVKPSYSRLTGSLNYVGRHEIEGGNPGLRDERMHDVRLFGIWNDFMLQSDWMYSTYTYAYVKQVYPANGLQLLMHPININVTSFSLYLTWSKAVRRWTPNITLGMRKQWLDIGRTTYDRPIFSYYLDNTFNLPRGWLITADISGQSKGDMHTNRFGATGFAMNASVGRSFLHKSLNIKLSATDIFNTANNDWTMNTYGIFVDKRQQYDRRGVHLNIIYRFHPLKSKYKGEAANEAEMNRF